MRSNAKMYPQSFYQILLLLKEDGTPLTLPFRTKDEAEAYRFQYYNFLKWCRRPLNAAATAHLQGRYNMVQVKLDGPHLIFSLRTQERFAAIDDAFTRMLEAEGIAPPSVPKEFLSPTRDLPRGEVKPLGWSVETDAHVIPAYKPEAEAIPPHIMDERLIPPGAPADLAAFFSSAIPEAEQRRNNQILFEAQAAAIEEKRTAVIPKRIGWYPKDTKVELSVADRDVPEAQLGRALDAALFEDRTYIIPYPTAKNDEHATDDARIAKHFKLYSDLLLDNGLMGAFHFVRSPTGFEVQLTDEAHKVLKAFMWPSVRLEACVTWQNQNTARKEISALFKEHTL